MTQSTETDRITYDKGKHVLRFAITDGGASIPCAVSKAALAALEDDALAGPDAMCITYQRNRIRIQAAALRKYQAQRVEKDGIVMVWRDDITACAPGASG